MVRVLALLAMLALTTGALGAGTDLRVALPTEPQSLDPLADRSDATAQVAMGNIFETLVALDGAGDVVPALAERFELAPDGLSITLSLRRDVNFHDGSAFDARDVAYTLGRLIGNDAALAALSGTAVVDDVTLRLVLSYPDKDLLEKLADVPMVAPESADNNGQMPIGTGPFAFVDWYPGDRVLLERNEYYWGAHPKLVKAALVFVPDTDAAMRALEMGDVDGLAHVADTARLERLRGNGSVFVTANGAWKVGLSGLPVEMGPRWMVLSGLGWE